MFRNNRLHDSSHNAVKYLKKIKKLTYFYIMIMLLKLLFGDFNSLLMDIFNILLLYCMFTNISHMFIAWVMIALIMTAFSVLLILLFFIQDIYLGFFVATPIVTFYMIILITQLILFILLINNCFQLYKESRAIFRNIIGRGSKSLT